MILIYLQNTFDSLDSKILLEKMTCLGFKAPVIRWFESYKSSRKFFVSEDDVFLEAGILNCGIPQGPILGPLLFLIYIKNLPQSLWESDSYSYAHDTCIFNQDTGVHKIEDVLNKELSTLYTINKELSAKFLQNILYKNCWEVVCFLKRILLEPAEYSYTNTVKLIKIVNL